MVTPVTAPEGLPCQTCRLLHHLAFLVLKETDPGSSSLPLDPESVTDSLSLLLVLYPTLCVFLYTVQAME